MSVTLTSDFKLKILFGGVRSRRVPFSGTQLFDLLQVAETSEGFQREVFPSPPDPPQIRIELDESEQLVSPNLRGEGEPVCFVLSFAFDIVVFRGALPQAKGDYDLLFDALCLRTKYSLEI